MRAANIRKHGIGHFLSKATSAPNNMILDSCKIGLSEP